MIHVYSDLVLNESCFYHFILSVLQKANLYYKRQRVYNCTLDRDKRKSVLNIGWCCMSEMNDVIMNKVYGIEIHVLSDYLR